MTAQTKVSFQRLGRAMALLPLLAAVSGCARSPAFNILGSYFPGWLACILLGILIAAGIRAVLHHMQWEERIAALPLFYLGIAIAVACGLWLVAFE